LKKIITKIFLLFFISFFVFPPQIFARILICESFDNRYNYCSVKHNGNIRIISQFSSAGCVKGRDWGYDRNGIWVDNGCRAEFEISFFDYDSVWGESGYFSCESQGFEYRYCPAYTGSGVTLIKQFSNEECIKGKSWDYDRNGIWVNNGCRGEFILNIHNNRGWHRDRYRHHHDNSDEVAAAIGIIGGLALLGIIAGSKEDNNIPPPPPPPHYYNYYNNIQEDRAVPYWLIGVFRGYSNFYQTEIEIKISPNGILDGTLWNNKLYGIYSNGMIIFDGKSYIADHVSDGFIAKQKGNYNYNQIYFKKIK